MLGVTHVDHSALSSVASICSSVLVVRNLTVGVLLLSNIASVVESFRPDPKQVCEKLSPLSKKKKKGPLQTDLRTV